MLRRCAKCGVEKELNTDNFYRKRTGRYGFDSQCKECKRKRDKKRYQKDHEKICKQKCEYYQKNKETIKKKNLEYYYEHQDRDIAKDVSNV